MIIGLKTENKTIVNSLAAFLKSLHMSTMLYVQFARIWEPNVLDLHIFPCKGCVALIPKCYGKKDQHTYVVYRIRPEPYILGELRDNTE